MIRTMAVVGVAGALLAGCHSADPRYYYTDQDCLHRQNSSRVLAVVTGIGLGVAGVPAGGLVGLGLGMATDPRCQAYFLTPEGRVRLRRDIARERGRDALPIDARDRLHRPAPPPASGRPLDNLPSNTSTPPVAN